MGTDASHQADSSLHTAPLPTPAALSSDTPIAPTPEQVNKPGSEPRGAGRWVWPLPHVMEALLSFVGTPFTPHSSPTGVCYSSCLGDEAEREKFTCPEPHSSSETELGFKLKSV